MEYISEQELAKAILRASIPDCEKSEIWAEIEKANKVKIEEGQK